MARAKLHPETMRLLKMLDGLKPATESSRRKKKKAKAAKAPTKPRRKPFRAGEQVIFRKSYYCVPQGTVATVVAYNTNAYDGAYVNLNFDQTHTGRGLIFRAGERICTLPRYLDRHDPSKADAAYYEALMAVVDDLGA